MNWFHILSIALGLGATFLGGFYGKLKRLVAKLTDIIKEIWDVSSTATTMVKELQEFFNAIKYAQKKESEGGIKITETELKNIFKEAQDVLPAWEALKKEFKDILDLFKK